MAYELDPGDARIASLQAALARVDERLAAQQLTIDQLWKALDDVNRRLDSQNDRIDTHSHLKRRGW